MMKNSLLTIAILGLCAAPAVAGKHATTTPVAKKVVVAPVPAPATKPLATDMSITQIETNFNFGGTYEILDRTHGVKEAKVNEPTLKLKTGADPLTAITPQRLADIEFCWDRLPAARRTADTTATVKLSVDPIGSVALATVTGEKLHPELTKCIASAAGRWRFPVQDLATEVEYAVALKTTTLNR